MTSVLLHRIKKTSADIAMALKISGPFNIQFLSKNNDIKVIECNLRASRSFPFVSKTFNVNFISLATKVMLGLEPKSKHIDLFALNHVCMKVPMFSFTRLAGADPITRVEMASTGEVRFDLDLLLSLAYPAALPSDITTTEPSVRSDSERKRREGGGVNIYCLGKTSCSNTRAGGVLRQQPPRSLPAGLHVRRLQTPQEEHPRHHRRTQLQTGALAVVLCMYVWVVHMCI